MPSVGGGTGLVVVASWGWKQPDGVSMGSPVVTEHGEGTWWQGDVAVLCALAAMDMDDHAGAVDVADLEIESFLDPQAEGVDGPEEGLVVRGANGVDKAAHLVDAEDIGQRLGSGNGEGLEGGPVAWDGVSEEEEDAAGGDFSEPASSGVGS